MEQFESRGMDGQEQAEPAPILSTGQSMAVDTFQIPTTLPEPAETAQQPVEEELKPAETVQLPAGEAPQPFSAGSTLVRPQPSPEKGTGYIQQVPDFSRQRTYAAPTPTVEVSSPRATAPSGGNGGSFLWGLLGGLIGAAAVVGALFLTGVLVPRTVQPAAPGNAQQGSPAFSITASDTDVSVARAVAAKVLPSVVSVHCTLPNGMSTGSGVILDDAGNIITNNHVIEDARSITVTIEGATYDAEIVGTDASSDIAVIKADLGDAQVVPIEVGDSSALAPGDWVMTVGSPFGLDSSVSSGIVSSLYRSELMYGSTGNTVYTNLIQVDAAINPGNSGGALVNAWGQLVGICTLFSSDTQSFAGIGFAIPGNYATEIAQMIINGEQVTHAYIGLSMMTVNEQNAQTNGLSVDYGAYVAEVIEDGPAEAAGIQTGDVVIAIDGERIDSADRAVLAIRSHRIGETVTVVVMRGEERLEFEVVLGSDEKLQELQLQQREQQQREQEQQNDFWNNEGEGMPDGDISYEDIFNWWIEEMLGEEGGR